MTAAKLERILVTDAQWSYIRRLMNEAFSHIYRGQDLPNIDVHHQPRHYTKQEASADILRLLAIKGRGWKERGAE